jgi:NADPH2:quinone reductase
VSSPEKAAHARAAGADDVIDYRRESVAERVRAVTDGRGADRVIEVDIAGNAALLPAVVARDGLCVVYGSNAPRASFEFGPMILSGAAVRFFIVYELSRDARSRGVADLTRWMEEGRLRHAIAAALPLERTAEAHEMVQGGVMGNVVVLP